MDEEKNTAVISITKSEPGVYTFLIFTKIIF